MSTLGRLERIDNLRLIWAHEEQDFTPWLASDENLALLAETLGLDGLDLEGREVGVGGFSADILARDTAPDGGLVLIENMFGRSDHDHLGKCLTYASGLKARTVVLIAETLREEHRAALDWLNDITSDDHAFFGCELQLWRIGDSAPAPRFDVVVQPNGWVKETQTQSRSTNAAPTFLKEQYRKYWDSLADQIKAADTRIALRSPRAKNWYDFSIGTTGCVIRIELSQQKQRIQLGVYLQGDLGKQRFAALEAQRSAIDAQLGFTPIWDALPNRQSARIGIELTPADPTDPTDWPRQHDWLVSHLVRFERAFRPYIAQMGTGEAPQ